MWRSLLLVALLTPALCRAADEVVLRDGTIVRGELIGFQGGNYLVRIGRFQKSIPEAQVVDVRNGGVSTPRPVVLPPAGAATPPAPTGNRDSGIRLPPGDPAAPAGEESEAVQQLLKQSQHPDPNQLQQLQNNPAIGKLVDRFRDRAYQQSLLDGLKEMVDKQNPGQGTAMLDQLQTLFNQLNTVGEAKAPGVPPPGVPVEP
jgi:hypothetical protein